jgi:hypothetical protein
MHAEARRCSLARLALTLKADGVGHELAGDLAARPAQRAGDDGGRHDAGEGLGGGVHLGRQQGGAQHGGAGLRGSAGRQTAGTRL